MVKFMILFRTPAPGASAAFENRYNDFLALIERMPNIRRRQVISVTGSPLGSTTLYRILEVYFDDTPIMEAALLTPAGQEAGRELGNFAAGTFELIFADVYEEQGASTPDAQS